MNLSSAIAGMGKLFRYWKAHPVASRDLTGTVLRFLKWQLACRVLGRPVIMPWIGGSSLVMERGMTGATMNHYCGLHEFSEMAFLLHYMRPGELFLDIGANVGTYTVLASGVCHARSMAVEPVPSTHARLLRNIAVNGISPLVTACRTALGSHDGMIRFTEGKDTMNRVAPQDYAGATVDVPVSTIDALLSETPGAVFWKVDVEGYETQVLQGAFVALKNPVLRALLLESTSPDMSDHLRDLGFTPCRYDPFSRSLVGMPDSAGITNCLWIRDPEKVMRRLREARAFEVLGLSI